MNPSKKTKVNGLLFKELVKRGYSLEGNTRVWNVVDSKLWYLTPEQSQDYLDLENSNEYLKVTNQKQGKELVLENSEKILEKIGKEPANVVDLGCGDGKKAANIVMSFKGRLKLRYCPIDISSYMVQKAFETFSKLKITEEMVQFQYNISDFENLENITPLLSQGEFKRNIFLLLGNTLGNFEVHELLYEIRNAMRERDILLVDTEVAGKNVQEKAQSHLKNDKVNKFLMHIPLYLGLEKEDVEYGARFKNSRIELYYTIKNDKTIVFQDKKVQFNIGDQITVAVAYKHKKEDLLSVFKMYFSDVSIFCSKDNTQCLFLCKK